MCLLSALLLLIYQELKNQIIRCVKNEYALNMRLRVMNGLISEHEIHSWGVLEAGKKRFAHLLVQVVL